MSKVNEQQIPTEIVSVETVRSIEQQRNGTIAEANRHQVRCRSDSEFAVTLLRRLTEMINLVNQKLEPIVKKAHETHKAIVGLKNNILEPLLEAKKNLHERNQAWCRAEEERVEKERMEAEEKARKRDEKREKLQDYHESMGHQTTVLEPTKIEEPAPFIPTTKERITYDVYVVNKALVPEEYKLVDLVGIRKLMLSAPRDSENRPLFDMPGIEVIVKKIAVYA